MSKHKAVLERIARRMDDGQPAKYTADVVFDWNGRFTDAEYLEAWTEVAAAVAWTIENFVERGERA